MSLKLRDFINLKTAIAGAIIMGSMVYYVNYQFGWQLASIAAFKQAVYTFFFGGACVRLSEVVAVKVENKWAGIFWGTVLASMVTISAVFIIHSMKGTPKPFESTLPTAIMAPPSFLVLAWLYRNKDDKEKIKKERV